MTVVAVRRVMMIFGERGDERRRAVEMLTGMRANEFGRVLPIQNGRWNWVMERRV